MSKRTPKFTSLALIWLSAALLLFVILPLWFSQAFAELHQLNSEELLQVHGGAGLSISGSANLQMDIDYFNSDNSGETNHVAADNASINLSFVGLTLDLVGDYLTAYDSGGTTPIAAIAIGLPSDVTFNSTTTGDVYISPAGVNGGHDVTGRLLFNANIDGHYSGYGTGLIFSHTPSCVPPFCP